MSPFLIAFLIIGTLVTISVASFFAYSNYCKNLIEPFYKDLADLKNSYISYNDAQKFLQKYKALNSKVAKLFLKTTALKDFSTQYSILLQEREQLNKQFIEEELKRYDAFFSKIENKSLDNQQRVACIVNEDANLVVAGAGSGKTLTICGKVQYLINKGVNPKDILCISFTNKVCDELNERLNKLTGKNIDVLTFHKLALKILKDNGVEFKIADENKISQMLEIALNGVRTKDIKTLFLNLLVYCDNYVKMQVETPKEDQLITIKDVIDHAKQMANIQKYKRGTVELITLAQEKVKSQHELDIANCLFLNGIKYEYETNYKFLDNENLEYKPDFYLPEYDIYIEHFGIDESGKASWLKDEQEIQKYAQGIEWKKKLHEENGTKLVCTYSYQREELTNNLLAELKNLGVQIKPCTAELIDLLNKLYDFDGSFLETTSSFIKLFKNRELSLDDFNDFYKKATMSERYVLRLIKQIYINYQNQLAEKGLIDFEDMINKANMEIKRTKKVPHYKYIIVDEYQDVSINKTDLLKLLMKYNEAKLIAVGDDWQSIYRFAGSEVSLISNFTDEFKHSKIMKIEKTYRNSKELIAVSGGFIQKNKNQISKELKSDKSCYEPIEIYSFAEKIEISPIEINSEKTRIECIKASVNDPRIRHLVKVLDRIKAEKIKNVLLLVRNNFDLSIIQLWLENEKSGTKTIKNDNTRLTFEKDGVIVTCMTIHKSKGLESDAVVLFDIREGFRGLPDTLGDDNILKFVITSKDNIEYGEDRRLFYVALTRTKNKVYIISRTREESRFVDELISDYEYKIKTDTKYLKCPRCGGSLVQIPGKGFYGCENYFSNQCGYTISATNDNELIEIRKYKEALELMGNMGTYLPCKILDIEWVRAPIGDAAIKVKYAFCVGNTMLDEFTTYINKKDDTKNIIKTSRFITTLRKNDYLDPFKDFKKYKDKYTGAMQKVHVLLQDGHLEMRNASDWFFKPFEE